MDSFRKTNMTGGSDNQDSMQRAPQVCSHCKSIKKGCDKRLPSCSQCIKRRAVCRYGEPDDRRSGSDTGRDSSPGKTVQHSKWNSLSREERSRLSPSARLSLLLMSSASDTFPSSGHLGAAFTSSDLILHLQIIRILESNGGNMDDVVRQYFKGIHPWLPIISRKLFTDRYNHFQVVPAPEFSILLLAMRLINQQPSIDPEIDQDREMLYLATKTLFAQVQAFIPASLYLIQAGIILSRYEHAHGMIEAAYISVGTIARMAFAIGMQNKHCSTELQGSNAWLEDEEMLCTWWGLVIVDRTIACDSLMNGRPIATRPIREDDYLPLEIDDMENGSIMDPPFRYFVSATSLHDVGTFGREAQATYCYDRVRNVIEKGDSMTFQLYNIGGDLQQLLATVMEQAAGQWSVFCGAMQMLITSLYTLHQTAHMQSVPDEQLKYRETIEVALNTLTRMVIDIAYAFNRECSAFKIESLSPAISHIVRCAQHHIITAESFHDSQWLEDYDQLRRMLSFFNRRWALAGVELHRLNETM